MTVAFDNSNTGSLNNTTSLTVSLASVGTPSCVVAFVYSLAVPSGITYDGNSMGAAFASAGPDANGRYAYIYGLNSTATGSKNFVLSFGANTYADMTVATFTGSTTGHVFRSGSNTGATAGSGNPSITVSSSTNDLVVDCGGSIQSLTVVAGQTQISNVTFGNIIQGTSRKAGAASVTMGWTIGGTEEWVQVGASIEVSSGAAAFIASSAYQNGRVVGAGVF